LIDEISGTIERYVMVFGLTTKKYRRTSDRFTHMLVISTTIIKSFIAATKAII